MKKSYFGGLPSFNQAWLWVLLLVGLVLPSLSFAQTFNESFGTTATEGQTVADYEANLGFDNDNENFSSFDDNINDSIDDDFIFINHSTITEKA